MIYSILKFNVKDYGFRIVDGYMQCVPSLDLPVRPNPCDRDGAPEFMC